RVRITGPEHEPEEGGATAQRWEAARLDFTTAGLYWAERSWRCFFHHAGSLYFSWRAYWGQRLVLDLGRAKLLTGEEQAAAALARPLAGAEARGVEELLGEMAAQMAEVHRLLGARGAESESSPLWDRLRFVSSALHLAGVHRLRDCVPHLRGWEAID